MNAIKKAKLLEEGKIQVPNGLIDTYSFQRSGPLAGRRAVILEFEGIRVKLEISRKSKYTLHKNGKNYSIVDEDGIFIKNVKIIHAPGGAPNQVFLNIENRCIFNCAFCESCSKAVDEERLMRFITKLVENGSCETIALTTGVFPSVESSIKRLCRFVLNLRKKNKDIPIGVEAVVNKKEQIDAIKESGADEIKINVQLPRKDLFDAICGYASYDSIYSFLEHAVDVFGEGKVTSNIIYGLGEREEDILETLERLASAGIVATLRKVRLSEVNADRIKKKIGRSPKKVNYDKILRLALNHKNILKKFGLTTKTFKTMCLPCACCDLVPFIDV